MILLDDSHDDKFANIEKCEITPQIPGPLYNCS
jgi:hypothetical protein